MNGTPTVVLALLTSTAIGAGIAVDGTQGWAPYFLQYGALGLCTLMVLSSLFVARQVLKHLEKKDEQMQQLIDDMLDRAERERRV